MEITCPYCFETFDSKNIKLRCRNPRCNDENDDAYFDYWREIDEDNAQPMQKHVYAPRHRFLLGTDMSCDLCKGKNYNYVCPTCHNELPSRMIDEGSEIISVIGGPNSGKTHYIVALLNELRRNGFEIGLDATLMQVGDNKKYHTEKMFNDFINRLNKEHQLLVQTDKKKKSVPWIIRLDSTDPQIRGKQKPKKTIYLVFYDTAGENFNDRKSMEENAKYLSHSKAVIVLFDTLSIPKIMEVLEKNNEDLSEAQNATAFSTTWNALKNFVKEGQANGQNNEHLKNKPFAFVLSKFDVVLDHADDLGFIIQTFRDGRGKPIDKSYINGLQQFDLKQVEDANDAIVSVLSDREKWDLPEIPHEVFDGDSWGENARFFGMSSIGSTPDSQLGTIASMGIRPYRVMDPLLWIMYKLGGFGFKTFNS